MNGTSCGLTGYMEKGQDVDKQELRYLIKKYNTGNASESERRTLESWYDRLDTADPEAPSEKDRERFREETLQALESYIAATGGRWGRTIPLWKWLGRAAAAVLITGMVGAALYFPYRQKQQKAQILTQSQEIRFKNEIAPGEDKAILTLSDGSTMELAGNRQGLLTRQGNSTVNATGDELFYVLDPESNSENELYNTLTVPAGGQFRLTLPDGSKVWLNAASSLTYPVSFQGETRTVTLLGEGYFEVASNREKPFVVNANDMQVEVLGTHFNISAYTEDPSVRTTLLEGAVRVGLAGREIVRQLQPGEQAVFRPGATDLQIRTADTEAVTGWKNNLFIFDDTGIEAVMRQIARWYDVEVVYEGPKPDIRFTGLMPRNDMVSSVLKILELTGGVRFIIDGRTISVHSVR